MVCLDPGTEGVSEWVTMTFTDSDTESEIFYWAQQGKLSFIFIGEGSVYTDEEELNYFGLLLDKSI